MQPDTCKTHRRSHACTHACTHKSTFYQRVASSRQKDKQRQNLSYLSKQGNSPLTLFLWRWHHRATNIRRARCCVDETARNRQCEELVDSRQAATGGLLPHLVPQPCFICAVCTTVCFQGSQLSVADLVLRPRVVIPCRGCWLTMISINGKFSWQCVCGLSRFVVTSWGTAVEQRVR